MSGDYNSLDLWQGHARNLGIRCCIAHCGVAPCISAAKESPPARFKNQIKGVTSHK